MFWFEVNYNVFFSKQSVFYLRQSNFRVTVVVENKAKHKHGKSYYVKSFQIVLVYIHQTYNHKNDTLLASAYTKWAYYQ